MNRILACLILVLCLASSLDANAEIRTALVIGNGAYGHSPLKNPANDAKDIAASLSKAGFDVMLLTDADNRSMEKAIRDLGKTLRSRGGVGLFYFAGHGMQVQGRNYLIPVDADIESESDVRFESIDAGRILGKMEDAGNGMNIVILDACRNNPFTRNFRAQTRGLARMDAPVGSIVAYSTAPGSVAQDGQGRNGIYTEQLLLNMSRPGMDIEDVFKSTRASVLARTEGKQVPWESSSLIGQFRFVAGGEQPAYPAPAQAQPLPAQKAQAIQTAMLPSPPAPTEQALRSIDETRKDSFSSLRTDYWSIQDTGHERQGDNYELGTASISDGRLQLLAKARRCSGIALYSKFGFKGDFDIQIDYIFEPGDNIDKMITDFIVRGVNNYKNGLYFFMYKNPREATALVLEHAYGQGWKRRLDKRMNRFNGKMRYVRKGDEITGYYMREGDNDWNKSWTTSKTEEVMRVVFYHRNYTSKDRDPHADVDAVMYIDNFTINNADEIVLLSDKK